MKFTINNRKIKADDFYLIGFNLDYIAYFEFDEEWVGTVKTARFYQEDGYTDVVLVDDSCTIPPLVKGRLRVGVFNSEITTTYASLWVNASIKDGSGNPIEPAKDIYAQLIALIEAHMFKGEDGVGIESIVQTVISTESDGENVFTVTLTDGRTEDFVIKNGSAGKDGKSAYQYALEHGYDGTEEEWGQLQVDSEKNAELILNKVNAAERAKLEAQASAESAGQSAISAYNSNVMAEAAAERAETADASARKSATTAETMASYAAASETNAKQSEENAAVSMQNAEASAIAAEASATASQNSASTAAISENNAKSSSDSAANYAKQAEISMNTCELASSLANGAKIAAEKARDEILAIEIPTKVSQLENDNEYITKTVDNLVNYYTKSNTYSKEEILELIGNINTLQTIIVDILPDTGETNYIYLVPNSRSDTNIYDEYIFIQNKWEQIGSTDIDLTQYVKNEVFSSHTDDTIVHITDDERNKWNTAAENVTTVANQIGNKVDKIEGKGLSTEDYTTAEKTKIAGIEVGANNYTHPSFHPATMITEDSTHRFMTDSERSIISNLSSKYVSYTKNSGVDVRGTTQDTYLFNPGQLVVKDGIVIGGTAASAGLVTRGICGVTSPDTTTGSCAKENLYINYDGDNTYRVDRQLILQAGTIGTHYGNNLYEFTVPRGEIVKNYCDANYGKKSDLNSHTGNSTIHITADERMKWNDAVTTASSVSALVGSTSVVSQISAATENLAQVQIVTWEATD